MVNKPDGKKSLPDMDMNHNPVWDVLDGKVMPEKKAKNKTKVKKKKPSEMDEEIDYYFSELEKEEPKENYEEEAPKRKISFSTLFYIISGILVVLIMSLLLVIVLNYDKMTVSTNAMASQVVKSDQVMYKPDVDINRFNVVLVDNNGKEDLLRVIGMPGDRLEMKNDVLMINNAI
ncbi:MAG: S26 family signal peptidase, partial [Vagococcus sp.]